MHLERASNKSGAAASGSKLPHRTGPRPWSWWRFGGSPPLRVQGHHVILAVWLQLNVLAAGQSYRVAVRFVDVVDKNTVDYPDAVGFVGLGAETTFALTTLGGVGSLSQLEGITQLADGRIQIRCRGMVGSVCRVEFSPDLKSWQKLAELAVSESGTAEYLDSASADRTKFYRLKAN